MTYIDKEKEKEQARKWYLANSEKVRARSKARYNEKKAEILEQGKEYRQRNKDKIQARNANRYKNNSDVLKKRSAAWRKNNPERYKELAARKYLKDIEKSKADRKKWRTENKPKQRIYSHNRRARVSQNGGTLSVGLADRLFKLQQGKCACCGHALGDDYQLDHRMPVLRGGANEDWNMQLLRKRCNIQKHSKDPIDFMQSRGFLL